MRHRISRRRAGSVQGSITKVAEQDRQGRACDGGRRGHDEPSSRVRIPGTMQHERRRDSHCGRIEGESLLVALVALSAVRKAIGRAVSFGALMTVTTGIENPDSGVLLRGQFHHARAYNRQGAVRKEHRREEKHQVTYSGSLHFSDTSAIHFTRTESFAQSSCQHKWHSATILDSDQLAAAWFPYPARRLRKALCRCPDIGVPAASERTSPTPKRDHQSRKILSALPPRTFSRTSPGKASTRDRHPFMSPMLCG